MDPSQIKLTTSQKIIPFLKAVNKELPFEVIIFFAVVILGMIFIPTLFPPMTDTAIDFLFRRIMLGVLSGIGVAFVMGGLYSFTDAVLLPLYKEIKSHYEDETLKAKKKVLDNVIDDEMLLK